MVATGSLDFYDTAYSKSDYLPIRSCLFSPSAFFASPGDIGYTQPYSLGSAKIRRGDLCSFVALPSS